MWQKAADWLTYQALGINPSSPIGASVNFFIYDFVKIVFILAAVVFAVTYVRTYLPEERIRKILAGKNRYAGHVLAALFGIITPFCSCSAVPMFIGFVEAGIPLGVTLSFLISAPLNNEIAIGILWASFGWQIALAYVGFGLLVAIASGIVIGRMNPERWLAEYKVIERQGCSCKKIKLELKMKHRLVLAKENVLDISKQTLPYIAFGIAVGALIHGYAPMELISKITAKENPAGVLVAVLIGVPLYSNAAGTLPIVTSLIGKGVPMGTALAFMMAVTALSFPEAVILKRVLKKELMLAFFGTVTVAIILIGYLFNAIM